MVIELANEVRKVLAVLGNVHPNDKKYVAHTHGKPDDRYTKAHHRTRLRT